MTTDTLDQVAEEYFYSINPLARRIGQDIAVTKDAYEGLWNTLSLKEQNRALDETIVQPEVALKYANAKKLGSPTYYPKLRIQTGLKYLIDDSGRTLRFKDEHSAPFSFMTQSQMNLNNSDPETNSKNLNGFTSKNMNDSLAEDNYSSPSSQISYYQSENFSDTIFSTEDCSTTLSCLDTDTTDGVFSKIVNKKPLIKTRSNSDDDTESLVPTAPKITMKIKHPGDKGFLNINFQKPVDVESIALLDTPSSFNSFQSLHTNNDPEIPKTGFEFLDNW